MTDMDAVLSGLSGNPGQGPYFRVDLRIRNEFVSTYSFATTDCMWATMTGITLGRLVEQRLLSEISRLNEQALLNELTGLPASNRTFVTHALCALHQILTSTTTPNRE